MPFRRLEPHRHDAPAALPLIACVAGLLLGPLLTDPVPSAAGLVFSAMLAARFSSRGVVALLFLAAGLLIGARQRSIRTDEAIAFHRADPERFVEVEAPVIGVWSRRGSAFFLKADSFTAAGYRFRSPLLLYLGQEPPEPGLASVIRFQGFLRQNDRGQFTASIKSPRLIEYADPLPWWHPQRWNRELAGRIAPLAKEHPEAVAIVEAVALGRTGRLSDATRESFRRGGTYHLLVFSGLQISAAAAGIALLLRLLGLQRGSDWFLLLFAVLAPPFIGGSASVSRAAVAVAAYALSRLLHRPTSLENLWCLAALIRLIAVPDDLREPGFQLTYGGAAALLFVARPVENRFARYVAAGAAAEMMVTPITLFHFHQFALGGSVLTFLLAPVIFTILLLSVPLFMFPCETTLMPIEILHRFCGAANAAGSPFSGFYTAPSPGAGIAAFGAVLASIAVFSSRRRAISITLGLAIPAFDAIIRAHTLSFTDPQLVMLDVGQGDAILLRNGHRSVLIDGGGRPDHPRFGESTLLPLLVDRGVLQLDAAILTHADPDHCGGLPAVLQHLRTRELWVSPHGLRGACAAELLHVALERGVQIRSARRGQML
ncbi:MAG TPA: ComEC/Rec2 family competence protein, partial [Thermoanaerobaculia bacterium]|nr:ComEC/Rec2 family competence protein [Thermoanaerobaculia bacterium]